MTALPPLSSGAAIAVIVLAVAFFVAQLAWGHARGRPRADSALTTSIGAAAGLVGLHAIGAAGFFAVSLYVLVVAVLGILIAVFRWSIHTEHAAAHWRRTLLMASGVALGIAGNALAFIDPKLYLWVVVTLLGGIVGRALVKSILHLWRQRPQQQ